MYGTIEEIYKKLKDECETDEKLLVSCWKESEIQDVFNINEDDAEIVMKSVDANYDEDIGINWNIIDDSYNKMLADDKADALEHGVFDDDDTDFDDDDDK